MSEREGRMTEIFRNGKVPPSESMPLINPNRANNARDASRSRVIAFLVPANWSATTPRMCWEIPG